MSDGSDWEHAGKPYERFVRCIQQTANSLAMRYGGPVYLVGGALTEEVPNDYDVRLVIGHRDWTRLFGQLAGGDRRGNWSEADWRRAYNNLKQSRELAMYLRGMPCRNVDFQIQLTSEANHHLDKLRVRIDAANEKEIGAGYEKWKAARDAEARWESEQAEKAAQG